MVKRVGREGVGCSVCKGLGLDSAFDFGFGFGFEVGYGRWR